MEDADVAVADATTVAFCILIHGKRTRKTHTHTLTCALTRTRRRAHAGEGKYKGMGETSDVRVNGFPLYGSGDVLSVREDPWLWETNIRR